MERFIGVFMLSLKEYEDVDYVVFRGHEGFAVRFNDERGVVLLPGALTMQDAEEKAAKIFDNKE